MNKYLFNVAYSCMGDMFTFGEFDYAEADNHTAKNKRQPSTFMLPKALAETLPIGFAYIEELVAFAFGLVNRIEAVAARCRFLMGCRNRIGAFPIYFEPFHLGMSIVMPIGDCQVQVGYDTHRG